MKIIVLHGDYIKKSRDRLEDFISSAQKIDSNFNLTISEQLSANSLFQKESLFILEDIKRLNQKDIDWIKKRGKDLALTLIIYHQGFIPKKVLNSFPKDAKIEEFKLPRIIFMYLDSIYPKNVKKVLVLFHELIRNEPVEFVFALMAKHLRDLYWVKVEPRSLPYPSWRITKLKVQSEKFKVEMIKEIIRKLAEIDIAAKTSKSDLISSLDLLMLTKLE